ncbi:MFS transporter [Bosea caraganae]|uniref:MFS transporter n=1 Tax=Bosea caraganae TaxID=2763117 RepID=A0A370L8T2_9HYPH|nr:MFS transporter [Bosea caraganae]RDJ26666.1 MFS transporter [Bosea caraganae]RDJ30553.1 MFS transporter [Bosea caraganae]
MHPQPEPAGRLSVAFIVCLAALILPLSFSGGAVATPAIGRDLGGSATALTWITNAFMLTFGSLLMTAGALADQFGRKRIFIGGVALFVLFSGALSFAPSLLVVDLLRAGQGVGAAAALAGGSAAMAQEFEGRARIRAFSMLGTTFGIGLAFGPIVAGVLIAQFGWRSIFLTSTLVGAGALVLGMRRLRETRDPNAAGLDWPGALSFTGMLSLFTFAIIQAPESGWTSPPVLGLFTGAAILLASFILVETRVARPMLDLSLFRYPRFVGVQVLPIATCYSYVVLLILLPLRFIGIEGLSEIEAGWLMMALSAPMVVVPALAAAGTRWLSAGAISALGLLIAAAGLLWLGRIGPGAPHEAIAPMLLIGLGAGMPWGLMDGLSVTVVPKDRAGMASGIFNTTKVAGEGVALAIVSAGLALLSSTGLQGLASQARTASPQHLSEAGLRLATGDLAQAATLLPEIGRALLVQSYFGAFETLTHALAAVTILSALIIFWFLSRERSEDHATGQVAASAAELEPVAADCSAQA